MYCITHLKQVRAGEDHTDCYLEMTDTEKAQAAENAKLREALEGMLKWFGKYPVFVPVGEALEDGRVDSAIEQARAALA